MLRWVPSPIESVADSLLFGPFFLFLFLFTCVFQFSFGRLIFEARVLERMPPVELLLFHYKLLSFGSLLSISIRGIFQ